MGRTRCCFSAYSSAILHLSTGKLLYDASAIAKSTEVAEKSKHFGKNRKQERCKKIVNPLIIEGLRDLTGIPEDANDEEAEGEEDDEEDVDEEDEGESEKKRNSQKEKEEARQHIKIIKPQRW